MRTIIAGSRGLGRLQVDAALRESPFQPTVVLSGTARGVDRAGEQWARDHNIPVEQYPADWSYYGKQAGYRRNEQMASKAEALIAVWDGSSRGTGNMIKIAESWGLKVFVWRTG